MTVLEKIRTWLDTFPGSDRVADMQVDYYESDPQNGSIAPAGLLEINRSEDILGNITVENQYNFALYYTFPKATDDDAGSTENAEWLISLQEWVQEQSLKRAAPVFGDVPKAEQIKAQNGCIYNVTEEGVAEYMVQLSVNFKKIYEVN